MKHLLILILLISGIVCADEIPPLSAKLVSTGKEFSFSQIQTPAAVIFWNDACLPSYEFFTGFPRKYSSKAMHYYAINLTENRDYNALKEKESPDITHLYNPDNELYNILGISYPITLVIGPDKNISYQHIGTIAPKEMEPAIMQFFPEKMTEYFLVSIEKYVVENSIDPAAETLVSAAEKLSPENFSKIVDYLLKSCRDPMYQSYLMGVAMTASNKLDEAQKYLDKALEVEPTFYRSQFAMGELLLKKKDYQNAIKHIHKAIEISGGRKEQYIALAQCAAETRDYNTAIENLTKALQYEPDNYTLTKKKAEIEYQNGDWDSALLTYGRCIKLKPNEKSNYERLTEIYEGQKNYSYAASAYDTLMKHESDPEKKKQLQLKFIEMIQLSGESKDALYYYEKFLELYPDDEDTDFKYSRLMLEAAQDIRPLEKIAAAKGKYSEQAMNILADFETKRETSEPPGKEPETEHPVKKPEKPLPPKVIAEKKPEPPAVKPVLTPAEPEITETKEFRIMYIFAGVAGGGALLFFIIMSGMKRHRENQLKIFEQSIENEDWNTAVQAGEKYRKLSKIDPQFIASYALALFKSQNYTESEELYKQLALTENESKYFFLCQLSEIASIMGKKSESLKYISQALMIKESEEMIISAITILEEENHFSELMIYLKKLEQFNTAAVIEKILKNLEKTTVDGRLNDEYLRYLAELYLKEKDYPRACDILKQMHDKNPANMVVTKKYAESCELNNNISRATELYKKLLTHSPASEEFRKKLAALYAQTPQKKALFEHYSKLYDTKIDSPEKLLRQAETKMEKNPSHEDYAAYAQGYFLTGNVPRAIQLLKECSEKLGYQKKTGILLLEMYYEMEKWEEAASCAREFSTKLTAEQDFFLLKELDSVLKMGLNERALKIAEEIIDNPKAVAGALPVIEQFPEEFSAEKNLLLFRYYTTIKDSSNACEIYEKLNNPPEWAEFRLAGVLADTKNNAQAIEKFEKLVESDEFSQESVKRLASLYFETGNLQNAVRMCKKMYAIAPERSEKIISSLEKILKINPQLVDGVNLLARLYINTSQNSKAIELLESSVSFASAESLNMLAELYKKTQKHEKFIILLKQRPDILTKYPSLLSDYALSAAAVKDYTESVKASLSLIKRDSPLSDKVIRILEKEFEKNNDSAALALGLAEIFCLKRVYDKALLTLKKSPHEKNNRELILKKAEIYGMLGENDKALNLCSGLYTAVKKKNKTFYNLYTTLLIRNEQYDQALAVFTDASREYPDILEYSKNIGIILEKLNKYSEAISHYKKIEEKWPADVGIKRCLKRAEQKMLENKILLTEKKIADKKASSREIFELSRMYFNQESYDKAIERLQMIPDNFAEMHEVEFLMGMCFMNQGMYESAKASFEKLFSHQASDLARKKEILYTIASVYEENRFLEEASSFFQRVIAEDINYKDCAARIEGLKSEIKKNEFFEHSEITAELRKRFKNFSLMKIGGMGRIYKAFCLQTNRWVAIKMLADKYKNNPEALKRFIERDGHSVQKLNHDNIVKVFEVNEGTQPYIVMEYVDGDNLTDILETKGKFSEQETAFIGKQIIDAISYAHKNEIIHRDIKPENIMLDDNQQVKILDFGLARKLDSESMTKTGNTFGTVFYMAPEQLKGNTKDFRSDIYSLGITFYEMLTGSAPFKGEIEQVMYAILYKEPESLSELGISLKMTAIIEKCIKKNADDRYATIEDLLSDWMFLFE